MKLRKEILDIMSKWIEHMFWIGDGTVSSIRLLHTADVHLGKLLNTAVLEMPEAVRQSVEHAVSNFFVQLIDEAIAQQVDAVIIAGDLYEVEDPPVYLQYVVHQQFRKLENSGIPVVLCHGNHDPVSIRPLFSFGNNVHILGVSSSESGRDFLPGEVGVTDVVLTLQGKRVQFSGFSFTSKSLYGSQVHHYKRLDGVDYAVGLYHGQVGESTGKHEAYAATTVSELKERRGFDVWALGHIHSYQVLSEQKPLIVYPGTPQGRDRSEAGEHGYVILDMNVDGRCVHHWIPSAHVVWHEVAIDVSDLDTVEAVWAEIRSQIVDTQAFLLVDLALSGNTTIYEELADSQMRHVFQEFAEMDGFQMWIHRYTSACAPPIDWDVWRQTDGYVSEVLALLDGLQSTNRNETLKSLTGALSAEEAQMVEDVLQNPDAMDGIVLQARKWLLGAMKRN